MSEYHVFETEQEAIDAELDIRTLGHLPRVGVNAKTKQPAPDKQKTERWAVPQQRADGKWCFPCVPTQSWTGVVTYEQVQEWYANHPNTIEEYDRSWFPTDEDEPVVQ
jgi:hypothetical protein